MASKRMQALDNIRIVLIGTTHPGNLGSAARAMKTMGLSRLHLVAPQHRPNAQAHAMASRADDILDACRVHETLDQGVSDAALVVGLSARSRRLSAPAVPLREAAREIMAVAQRHPVAVLFGREHSGLSNEEIDRCQRLIYIPANAAYSSLNLAAAVQVVAYELRLAALADAAQTVDEFGNGERDEPPTVEHLESFYRQLEQACRASGMMDHGNDKILMRRLRRLFSRAQPDRKEINILRGIFTQKAQRR